MTPYQRLLAFKRMGRFFFGSFQSGLLIGFLLAWTSFLIALNGVSTFL